MSYNCTWKTCNNNSSYNPNFGKDFNTNSTNTYVDSYTHYSRNIRNDLRVQANNNSYTFRITSVPFIEANGRVTNHYVYQ